MNDVATEVLETQQPLNAMLVLIMAANSATAEYAAGIEMIDETGATVFGTEAAHKILIGGLLGDQQAWAQWLLQPDNANEAVSLAVALSPQMRAELGGASPVVKALSLVRRPVASTARMVDLRDSDTAVIDLRESAIIS